MNAAKRHAIVNLYFAESGHALDESLARLILGKRFEGSPTHAILHARALPHFPFMNVTLRDWGFYQQSYRDRFPVPPAETETLQRAYFDLPFTVWRHRPQRRDVFAEGVRV